MGGLISIKNSAGSTFKERAGGGNFYTRNWTDNDGVRHSETMEGVWMPSGTGEANLGTKGTVDSSRTGGANVVTGGGGKSRGNSVNFSSDKRRVYKSNSGSSASSRALNIV